MNLIQRLKNLWLLSNFTIKKNSRGGVDVFVNEADREVEIKPHLAQVIKRSTPVDDFMKQTKENV